MKVDEDPFSGRGRWRIYSNGKTVAGTERVIGHRVAILEHAETDGDEERGNNDSVKDGEET